MIRRPKCKKLRMTPYSSRNGSNQVVRGWMWGLRYVDELVAVLRNDDYPWANDFTHAYHVLQDANYNVLGVVDGSAAIVERYEYTPYGERTVLRYGGSNDPGCYAPSLTSSVPSGHYAGLCDIGHQGLMHDEESGLIYNRARHLQPQLGRFMQRDPAGYVDGMNAYECTGSCPTTNEDPYGLEWHVHRKQGRRAMVDGECGDTVADLAKKTNMEPDKFVLWLKAEDGQGLPENASKQLDSVRRFSIPNQIVVGVGSMNWLTRKLTANHPADASQILMGKGFAVDYHDWYFLGPWDANDITKYGNDLYGIVYFGHGLAGWGKKKWVGVLENDEMQGALDIAGDGSAGYVAPGGFYDGQFGVLVLKSCFAAEGTWPQKASSEAHASDAVWLGSGLEASGVVFGIENTVNNAK